MIKGSGEDEKQDSVKVEDKKEEIKNEEYGDRKQENEQDGVYEEGEESDNQTIGEDDKRLLQEIEKVQTLPRTGNDYFIVKLVFIDFIIFVIFISQIYHKKDMDKSRFVRPFLYH